MKEDACPVDERGLRRHKGPAQMQTFELAGQWLVRLYCPACGSTTVLETY